MNLCHTDITHAINLLKQGADIISRHAPKPAEHNKAFDFSFNGQDCMLWIGQNAKLLTEK